MVHIEAECHVYTDSNDGLCRVYSDSNDVLCHVYTDSNDVLCQVYIFYIDDFINGILKSVNNCFWYLQTFCKDTTLLRLTSQWIQCGIWKIIIHRQKSLLRFFVCVVCFSWTKLYVSLFSNTCIICYPFL